MKNPAEIQKLSTHNYICELPDEIIDLIVSYANNPATLFFVNKCFRNVAMNFVAHTERVVTLVPDTIYYTVAGYWLTYSDGSSKLPCTEENMALSNYSNCDFGLLTREIDNPELSQAIYLKKSEVKLMQDALDVDRAHVLNAVSTQRGDCKVLVLGDDLDLKTNVFYFAKCKVSIRYAFFDDRSEGTLVVKNGKCGTCTRPYRLIQGEISFSNLPLLECFASGEFDLQKLESIMDRILDIIESRAKEPHRYRTFVPIFLSESEAIAYAQGEAKKSDLESLTRLSIVRPCTVKQKLILKLEQTPSERKSVTTYVSNLNILEGAYPVDSDGNALEVIAKKSICCEM